MAVNPDRDAEAEAPMQPLPGEVERERADLSVVSILAVLAVAVVAGLWFFTKDKEMIAGDGTTVTQTTGSRADQPASADTPAPVRPLPPPPMQPAPPSPNPSQQ